MHSEMSGGEALVGQDDSCDGAQRLKWAMCKKRSA